MSARRLPYTTDLTDEEWHILEPLLPPEKAGGRPRKYLWFPNIRSHWTA